MTHPPETVTWNGVIYRIVLPAAQSGNQLGIFQTEDFPGYGPPRHIHHDADESFVVLEGEVEFHLDGVATTCRSGDAIFVPRGTHHTFCVRGNLPARMLTVMTPGGFEGFFREMAAGAYRIPQDMAQISAIAARYHMEFTGPPLS